MRRQNFGAEDKSQWQLDRAWNFPSQVVLWGEAVTHWKTNSWLRTQESGVEVTERMGLFLSWVKDRRAELASQRQQRLTAHQVEERRQEVAISRAETASASSDTARVLCDVCLQNPKDVCFVPCRHVCACLTCADSLVLNSIETCPICRQKFDEYFRVYL